jgi:hypothetical protein
MSVDEEEFRPITTVEYEIIKKMLETKFRGRNQFVQQLVGLWAKPIDAQGSLRLRVTCTAAAPISRGIAVEARYPDLDARDESGPCVNLLLHVADGRLSMLEIYKDDGGKILKVPNPAEMKVY